MMRPHVLHLIDEFGARSQTFVYTLVSNHHSFTATVLCRDRVLTDEFPFDAVTVIPENWSRRSPSRWWAVASQYLTGSTPWQRRVGHHVRATQPDVLHAHFGQVGVRVLPAIQSLDIPLVTSFYGYDATGFASSRSGRHAIPALLRFSSLLLAEGPVMRERLIQLGATENRVRVVPIAIDLAKYPSWSPQPAPYVLFLARFVEKKGLPDAVAAFARARREVPSLRMRIVGNGPEEGRARSLADALGVSDAIDWLGLRTHRDCIELVRHASMLIQPSVTALDGDTEGGAPTTLIEAQAIGTPIVATRHADIPHIAPAGAGVWLADEHDVEGLAAGIVELLRRRSPSDAASARARHDLKQVMPRLEECYRLALQVRTRPAA